MEPIDEAKLKNILSNVKPDDMEVFLSSDGKNTVHVKNAQMIGVGIKLYDFLRELYGTKQRQVIEEYSKPISNGDSKPEGWCPIHQVQMKKYIKDGRSWYSHFISSERKWCNGKK